MRRAGSVVAAAVIGLLARSGAVRAQTTLEEEPGSRSLAEEKWPIEAVRRPLTLPAGMAALGVALVGYRPDRSYVVDPGTGIATPFSSSANLGVSVVFGVTDRLQASLAMPRFLCFETDPPSGCTGSSRYHDAGATLRVLAARGDHLQVAPAVRVSVSQTRPDPLLRWWLGTQFKVTALATALTFNPSVTHNFGTSPAEPLNPWLAYLPLGLNLQLAQRWLAYGVVQPWGSVGQLEQGIALQFHSGVGYTFGRHGEIDLAGGIYNVLERPNWYRGLGGAYVQLSAAFWRY